MGLFAHRWVQVLSCNFQKKLSFVILTPPTLNGHIFLIFQPLQVVIQMAMYAQLQALQHLLKLQKQ